MSTPTQGFAALTEGTSELQHNFLVTLDAPLDEDLRAHMKAAENYLATILDTILGLEFLAASHEKDSELRRLYQELIRENDKEIALLTKHIEGMKQEKERRKVRERDCKKADDKDQYSGRKNQKNQKTSGAMMLNQQCVTGALARIFANSKE